MLPRLILGAALGSAAVHLALALTGGSMTDSVARIAPALAPYVPVLAPLSTATVAWFWLRDRARRRPWRTCR